MTKVTMNPNKVLWEKGDFTKVAATMRASGVALVAKLGITKDLDILDLGCGDGTTAIPAAKLAKSVLGVDIAINLVKAGNERVIEEELANCNFEEGDAADLYSIADNSFDLIITVFGAMFSSNPFKVAKEMVRVTKQGGKIVMGNWIPEDPTLVAQILKICSRYTPAPPEGFVSPMLWGVEKNITERFESAGIAKEHISFVKDTFTFNADYSPADFLGVFRNYYGPTMNAFEAAEKNGKEDELYAELEFLFKSQNKSISENTTSIP
ncbi:class I SAM-dependent methyltransferase [Pedobacter frigiditerrae]|uniref:class I SAM-dependent methyltransferase n=1 Tax=Pedobacter frigiditerrae TaxID=2530452 RepID=UPI00292CFD19|nr:methyltransferase domain-containing protein [Pedobacter frigiditerrae]